MDLTKFKATEEKYRELKEKLAAGQIAPDAMKTQLKQMMVLDENGNYWMIGGKSGKWYIYNGSDWQEDNPYRSEEPSQPPVQEAAQETVQEREQETTHERVQEVEQESLQSAATQNLQEPFQLERHQQEVSVDTRSYKSESHDLQDSYQVQVESNQVVEQEGTQLFQQDDIALSTQDDGHQVELDYHQQEEQDLSLLESKDQQLQQELAVESNQDFQEQVQEEITFQEDKEEGFNLADSSMNGETELLREEVSLETAMKEEPVLEGGAQTIASTSEEEAQLPCLNCQSSIPSRAVFCPICGANQRDQAAPSAPEKRGRKSRLKDDELQISSINLFSLGLFLAVLGAIIGVIGGAVYGVFKTIGANWNLPIPEVIATTRGDLSGGLVFGGITGLLGFIAFFIKGVFLAIIYNVIASGFGGGIKIKIRQK